MNLYILGSCSGTELRFRRNHTSWVLEEDCGKLLMFDAGDNCAASLYNSNLNPYNVEGIFISHEHLDHTAGLPALFFSLKKEEHLRQNYAHRTVAFRSPDMEFMKIADKFARIAQNPSENTRGYQLDMQELTPGKIYEDDEVIVECTPTLHRPMAENHNRPASYAFRITAKKDGRKLIYSGDFHELDELKAWYTEPTRLLMLETGHHRACELCQELKDNSCLAENILFLHHGRAILADATAEKAAASAVWGKPILIATDAMVYVF